MAVKKLRKPLEIDNDGTSIVGLGYDTNGNPVVLLKGPSDNRAKSIQYNGIIPKIYIDELRDGSFMDRKDDIKKLMKYRKEFQSSNNTDMPEFDDDNESSDGVEKCPECGASLSTNDLEDNECPSCGYVLTTITQAIVKQANDVTGAFVDIYEAVSNLIQVSNEEGVDIKPYLHKIKGIIEEVTVIRDSIQDYKKTKSTVTIAKSASLSLKEYDDLIGGLIENGNFYLKDGDLSSGKIVLDWHSGSNVSIEFSVKALWSERKIEVTNAKLDVSGIESLTDSEVWKVVNKYLTDFKIPFDRPTDASEEEQILPPTGIEVKSAKILNKGNWNEVEVIEVDDSETEYRMLNKDLDFSTIDGLIKSMLDLAEVSGDYEDAIDFLNDIDMDNSIVDHKNKTGFVVYDISDFLDETVSDWEKDRGYEATINANVTKIIANITD